MGASDRVGITDVENSSGEQLGRYLEELKNGRLVGRKCEITPRSLREAEAESVALLCLETLGLDGADLSNAEHWTWILRLLR